MWQGGFPRGNLEAKNGGKDHKSHFTYFIILPKTSPAALYPVVNIKTDKLKLIFGQGNYGMQPLAMGGNKYEKKGRQGHRRN